MTKRKKITIEELQKRQKKAQKELKKLENEGYRISSYTIDMINKELTEKMTQKERAIYKERTSRRYLLSRAQNLKKSGGYQMQMKIKPVSFVKLPIKEAYYKEKAVEIQSKIRNIKIRKSKEGFAEDVYNMIWTAAHTFQYSRDARAFSTDLIRRLNVEVPLEDTFTEDVENLEYDIKKSLRSMSKAERDAFIQSKSFQRFLMEGIGTPELLKERRELINLRSEESFNQNHPNLPPERVETIYDFFSQSKNWYDVRKNYHPSNDVEWDEFVDNVTQLLDSGDVKVSDIDKALLNYHGANLMKVLDEAISAAKKRR